MLVTAATVAVAAAPPAQAATCATAAHVYANGSVVRWETDPLNGQVPTIVKTTGSFTIRFGGNGLRPGQDPFINIYQMTPTGVELTPPLLTFIGNRTGSNCVSNEKNFQVFGGRPGEAFMVRVTYHTGNSGRTISQQAFFKLTIPSACPATRGHRCSPVRS